MAEGIRSKRNSNGKLGSKFWSNLFEEFGLNSKVADTLPDLVDTDIPSSEMLDVLSAAHHDNLVRACVVPLERWLDHTPSLGGTATFGLLRAVQTCPTLPHHASVRAQVAVLRFWARTPWCTSGETSNASLGLSSV